MPATPLAAARAVIDAVNREAWLEAATACDPDSLALFKDYWMEEHARGNLQPDRIPVELTFADVTDPAELAAMEPAELFARYLEARSLRRMLGHVARHRGIAPDVLERLEGHRFPPVFAGALGVVPAGDEFAYVVCADAPPEDGWPAELQERWRQYPEAIQRMVTWTGRPVRLMHVRRQPDGSWRALAGDNFYRWPASVAIRTPEPT